MAEPSPHSAGPPSARPRRCIDPETLAVAALFAAVLVIALGTVDDYGISVDEWNADPYGAKSLAWYTSGFVDRAWFDSVEETLWYYGPWFHILVAMVQSLGVADHWVTRHAMTFMVGLAGIAAIYPMARLAFGRWAGVVAVGLCLITGYLYGSLFFTPIDIPFMFAMLWATCAIVFMASRTVPTWSATVAAGIFTGLAIATRASGLITHVYLAGALMLCALEALLQGPGKARRLVAIAVRGLAAVVIAWVVAYALWPWLQIGHPLEHFRQAFAYFAHHPASFEDTHWGRSYAVNAHPWHYIPGQLAARLPEGFLLLLAIGLIAGIVVAARFLWRGYDAIRRRSPTRMQAWLFIATRAKLPLIVWTAALLPVVAVIVQRSTLYDGIRHVMFVIPMAALIAAYGFVRVLPLLRRWPVVSALGTGAYIGYAVLTLMLLHPLQYVSFNVLAGGVYGAYTRFDQDYWALGATTALRRLERRLDLVPGLFEKNPPRIMICVSDRHAGVQIMFRRPWQLALEPEQADYIIETERWRCVEKDQPFVLIDEVKRGGRSFGWTYARQPHTDQPRPAP